MSESKRKDRAAKWVLERVFVFGALSLCIVLGVFNLVAPDQNKAAIVTLIMLTGFAASFLFWILFRMAKKA